MLLSTLLKVVPPSPRRARARIVGPVSIALAAALLSLGSCQGSTIGDGDVVSSGATQGDGNSVPLTGIAGANSNTPSGTSTAATSGTTGTSGSQGGASGGGTTDSAQGTAGTGTSSGGSGTPAASATSDATSGAATNTVEPPSAGTDDAAAEAEPCVDVEPPPDPEWPDATCATWAAETEECSAEWFAEYCDVSCGRCVPEGGGADAPPEPEPCEDVEPPPDPEWPDATCASWAAETEECSADWFADYCDVSCGRCVPESGGAGTEVETPAEPEPEPCEDVEPPPTEEWPDATCANWATETEECGAEWFAEYCDVSCGRCVPEGGLPAQPTAPDCSGEGLPNVTGGEGHATRYWDCCQTHCSQFNGHRCGQDGSSGTGDTNSACNGGGSFACYDEAPRAVSECLSYGHIAKANPNCGQCYRIQFTGQGEHNANDPGSKLIAGKQMIVKVTNTGGDVGGSQFDLMIPGGGVGQFNACSRQWGTSDLGAQYGGFLTNCSGSHAEKKECVRQECMKIPAGSARDGCIWFVDWLQVADNPKFTSQQTDCPF